MITVDNLKDVLLNFGFTESSSDVFKKQYQHDASITVDFKHKKITYAPVDDSFGNGEYPTKDKKSTGFVIHRDTTLNFDHNENFVCLVCVHLLLEKGYEPKHIVFEPAFRVGHINKPSYGDILVFNEEWNPLVLIENKTYGAEFSKEWNNMQKNGGQLFSYLGPLVNELGLCENLVLFAADYDSEDIVLKNHIITLKDNENTIAGTKTFADAQGKYFDVWNETYAKSFETKGLFESDVAPYSIGKLKYTLSDLKSLSHSEIRPIYHEFATILRNHAITDFEHSFYILIDLFLCKITDERRNPQDLQFYYKGITRDTPKKYCARLLKLYQQGKRDLFDVDVVNKDEDDIKQIFEDTSRSLTNGLFEGIKELFEEIKFYNIKKFNFIDVENKEEFEMNFQILIKIAALIQDINLSNSETNHFFGDLFEGLLSKNVHQTEGQFFTPLPIVNFIIKSLPEFPNNPNTKVLDYACGAGHFLTEFVKSYPQASAYGIEKSQTLSQVAKIATIINGSKDARIVFKDTLSIFNTRETRFQGFDNDSFDVIIANPPYSVKGFLNTLDENDRKQYELVKLVKEKAYGTNRTIESFFVERAKHFLRQNGLIGIVLPSSILSNEDAIAVKTRELLFAHFNILSIVSLGSRTFGSTGTNTIILFAQKVKKNAEGLLEHFITNDRFDQYTNYEAIDRYIEKQGYDRAAYYAFMQTDTLTEDLENHEIFIEYASAFKKAAIKKSIQTEWFKSSTFYNNGLKTNSQEYKQLFAEFLASPDYKSLEEAEYRKQFVAYAKAIECSKLYTYIQVANNFVLLLKTPPDKVNNKSNKDEIIKFLGYDWSSRKGDEGIKYITKSTYVEDEEQQENEEKDAEIVKAINSIRYIDTPLYNPDNAWDNTKYAFALRKHIYEQCKKFSFGENKGSDEAEKAFEGELNGLLTYANLEDLIDFTRSSFDKAIRTKPNRKVIVQSKFPLVKLGSFADIKKGQSITQAETTNGQIKVVAGGINYAYLHGSSNRAANTITISASGANAGFVNFWKEPIFASDCTTVRGRNDLESQYLFYVLQSVQESMFGLQDGAAQPHVYPEDISAIQVPNIALGSEIMLKIVSECQEIDKTYYESYQKVESCRNAIENIFNKIQNSNNVKIKHLGDICESYIGLTYKPTDVSSDGVLVLRSSNIQHGQLDFNDQVRVNSSIPEKLFVRNGDVLVCVRNGSKRLLGKAAYIDNINEPMTFGAFMAICRGDMGKWIHIWMQSRHYYSQLETITDTMSINELTQGTLLDLSIPVIPVSDQQPIISQVEQYEKEIASAQTIMDDCSVRKRAIVEKYLND